MQGPHIDELFGDRRSERLEFNAALAERSPLDTGTEPLQRFEDPHVEWFEYWPGPTAQFYAEMLMFSACHYRLRYAYTYSIQFDIDEFWYAGEHIPEKTLPAFLDKYMHPDAATMGFFQVALAGPLQRLCFAGALWSVCHRQPAQPQEKATTDSLTTRSLGAGAVPSGLPHQGEWRLCQPFYAKARPCQPDKARRPAHGRQKVHYQLAVPGHAIPCLEMLQGRASLTTSSGAV